MKRTDFKDTQQCIEFFDKRTHSLAVSHREQPEKPLAGNRNGDRSHAYSSAHLTDIFPASQNVWNFKTRYRNNDEQDDSQPMRSASVLDRVGYGNTNRSTSKLVLESGRSFFAEKENEEKRRNDHLFSDLLGPDREEERNRNR